MIKVGDLVTPLVMPRLGIGVVVKIKTDHNGHTVMCYFIESGRRFSYFSEQLELVEKK